MANTYSMKMLLASNQYASRADTADLSPTGDFTIEIWIKYTILPSVTTEQSTLVSKWVADQYSYILRIPTDNKLQLTYSSVANAGTVSYSTTDAAVVSAADTWYHLAVSVDVSTKDFKFYVNTINVADTNGASDAAAIFDGTANFQVGQNQDTPAQTTDGLINNLRLWGDVRTPTEIADNWKTILTNTGTDDLIDSWYYGNNDHVSASGNNDLTGQNSPTFIEDVPFTTTTTTGVNPAFFSNGGLTIL